MRRTASLPDTSRAELQGPRGSEPGWPLGEDSVRGMSASSSGQAGMFLGSSDDSETPWSSQGLGQAETCELGAAAPFLPCRLMQSPRCYLVEAPPIPPPPCCRLFGSIHEWPDGPCSQLSG